MLIPSLLILIQWIIVLLVLFGVGSTVALATNLWPNRSVRFATLGWLGLAVTVAWLYLIHILAPLDSLPAWLPLVLLGAVGWFTLVARSSRRILFRHLKSPLFWVTFTVLALAALYLANQALGQPLRFDSYLYHFATIDFYSNYEVIEGLANLHERLGFQTPVFPLASVAGVGLWSGEGFRVINGVFVLLFLLELCSRLGIAWRTHSLSWGSGSLLIALSLFVGFDGGIIQPRDPAYSIASPDIDIPAGISLIIAASYFIDAMIRPSSATLGLAILTGALAATFRPTNLVFFGVSLLCIAFVWLQQARKPPLGRPLQGMIALAAILIGAAVSHTVLLTGYPFYPAPVLGLNLPWTVPLPEVQAVSAGIRGFARFASLGIEPKSAIPWLWDWIESLYSSGQLRDLIWVPFTFLLGILALSLRSRGAKGNRMLSWTEALVFLPAAVSVAFWFYSAPLIRFGHAPLVVLVSLPLALALSRISWTQVLNDPKVFPTRLGTMLAVTSLIVIVAFAWIPRLDKLPSRIKESGAGRFGSQLPYEPKLVPVRTRGDWVRLTPDEISNSQCGRELRCTPADVKTYDVEYLGDGIEEGFRRLPPDEP